MARWALVSDLDDTLLGDEAALQRLHDWLAPRRDACLLVYASGRSPASMAAAVQQHRALPAPHYLIGNVGTEIVDCADGQILREWTASLTPGWSELGVRETAAQFAALTPQPEDLQTPWKASYFLAPDAAPEMLPRLRDALRAAGVAARILYSSGRHLDLLPRGAGKGPAAAFVLRRAGIGAERLVVCGDTGNDADLFDLGGRGIVVANAQPELKALNGPGVYQARLPHAAGVLEGLRHWGVLEGSFRVA